MTEKIRQDGKHYTEQIGGCTHEQTTTETDNKLGEDGKEGEPL
jgi:hypothetical protein